MQHLILNTIGEKFSEQGKQILESVARVDYKNLSQDEFERTIDMYTCLVVGLGLVINKKVLEKAKKLKVIATATTGLDHIDIEYAKQKGICILSLRGEHSFLDTITGTAELSWGLLLSLIRNIPDAFQDVKHGVWNREKFYGHSLYGKTLGIVGLGRLGKMMARYGAAFDMKVIFVDPGVDSVKNIKAEKVSFDTLLKESDVISIHVHLNNDTARMFNKEAFKKMKNNALLINTSRGQIVEETALIDALRAREIGGYTADVIGDELEWGNDIPKDHPLLMYALSHNNLLLTPHIGGMTYDSRERTDIFIAQKVKIELQGKD